MNKYRFIISVFGEEYIGMLLTNLYSIIKNTHNSDISVFWQDISNENKNNFKKAFPQINFNETNFDLNSDKIKRISSKMFFWNYASHFFQNQNLCFIDVDTLVIKDISNFFDDNFDIIFTDKEDIFPLNTGVILCKGESFHIFFEEWLKKTLEILSDHNLILKSISTKYPYGGGDQMALFQLINYKRGINIYQLMINNKNFIIKSIPCKILNETRSTSINNNVHIIHYKGGWQLILLKAMGFTKYRTKMESQEMYLLYLRTHKMALEYFNNCLGKNYIFGSFGIKVPFYLDKTTLKENKFRYIYFSLISTINNIIIKINNFIKK